jgi:hypothetical protein
MKQKILSALFILVSISTLVSLTAFAVLSANSLRTKANSGEAVRGSKPKGTENDFNLCGYLWAAAGELVPGPQTVAFGKFALGTGLQSIRYDPTLVTPFTYRRCPPARVGSRQSFLIKRTCFTNDRSLISVSMLS